MSGFSFHQMDYHWRPREHVLWDALSEHRKAMIERERRKAALVRANAEKAQLRTTTKGDFMALRGYFTRVNARDYKPVKVRL